MAAVTIFQLLSGMWNPAEKAYTLTVLQEYDTKREAQDAFFDVLVEDAGLTSAEAKRIKWSDLIKGYTGPPIRVIEARFVPLLNCQAGDATKPPGWASAPAEAPAAP